MKQALHDLGLDDPRVWVAGLTVGVFVLVVGLAFLAAAVALGLDGIGEATP